MEEMQENMSEGHLKSVDVITGHIKVHSVFLSTGKGADGLCAFHHS